MNRSQWFRSAIITTLVLLHPSMGEGATLSTLAVFNGPNGAFPRAGLLADASGNLYGTTSAGGANSLGTVFKVAAGTNTLTTLVSFDGTNGTRPFSELIADSSGNLYGTTTDNTLANKNGTVFKVEAGTNALTTLASFNGANGKNPIGGLIRDASGNLYGTTNDGGAYGYGTVFEVAAGTNALTTLLSFNGTNGSNPQGTLISDANGNLYGTTVNGGLYGLGTAFEIAAGTHALTTLLSFIGNNGSYPTSGLVSDPSGNLYGTTSKGGAYDIGTVFKIAAGTHALTTLFSFGDLAISGTFPYGGLLIDADGNLFGTVYSGVSPLTNGGVFKLAAGTNEFTKLVNFQTLTGSQPQGDLIADANGNLYGTTTTGRGFGTVYKLSDTGFVVVPEASSILLAAFGLMAFAIPCVKRVCGAK